MRNYHGHLEIVQRYMNIGEFFENGEFRFIKAKIFRKPKIFLGWESPALAIVFDGISKFWVRIPPSRPEIQALKIIFFHQN